jgi:hypothetical protein
MNETVKLLLTLVIVGALIFFGVRWYRSNQGETVYRKSKEQVKEVVKESPEAPATTVKETTVTEQVKK